MMEYRPPKPKSNEELMEKMKKLEERLEKLEAENRELRERLASSENFQQAKQAQEEIDKLIEKARSLIKFEKHNFTVCGLSPEEYESSTYARLLYSHIPSHYGCSPSIKIEGDKIIYGVQCNYPETRGFYPQGEIPIPKYLRKYL